MSEPSWPSIGDLIQINEWACASHPMTGASILRDLNALESGLAKPQSHYSYSGEENLLVLAAVLLFGIAKAHAFVDGNKRTAFHAMTRFFHINGYELLEPDELYFAEPIIRFITADMEVGLPDFVHLLAPHVQLLEID